MPVRVHSQTLFRVRDRYRNTSVLRGIQVLKSYQVTLAFSDYKYEDRGDVLC